MPPLPMGVAQPVTTADSSTNIRASLRMACSFPCWLSVGDGLFAHRPLDTPVASFVAGAQGPKKKGRRAPQKQYSQNELTLLVARRLADPALAAGRFRRCTVRTSLGLPSQLHGRRTAAPAERTAAKGDGFAPARIEPIRTSGRYPPGTSADRRRCCCPAGWRGHP